MPIFRNSWELHTASLKVKIKLWNAQINYKLTPTTELHSHLSVSIPNHFTTASHDKCVIKSQHFNPFFLITNTFLAVHLTFSSCLNFILQEIKFWANFSFSVYLESQAVSWMDEWIFSFTCKKAIFLASKNCILMQELKREQKQSIFTFNAQNKKLNSKVI